jgi:hypothetical protein
MLFSSSCLETLAFLVVDVVIGAPIPLTADAQNVTSDTPNTPTKATSAADALIQRV